MGINIGARIAPVITGWLAAKIFGTDTDPHYQWVFIAAGIGMVISLIWFWPVVASSRVSVCRRPVRKASAASAWSPCSAA